MTSHSDENKSKITYKDAGVDIEKADEMVEWMKDSFKTEDPHPNSLVSGIGGFAALFKADFKSMEAPVLVSSTDGIGTKLLMGLHSGHTAGLAQDLVGMCVNDLLCTGGQPLFFLDYFATSGLNEDQLKEFLLCLKKACTEADVSLIGGETAELPGLYQKGHFDAAGFSVGVVDEVKAWGAKKVKEGDVIFGIKSSGFHSNGYSLLRKIFGEDGGGHAKSLMAPTKLYSKLVKSINNSNLNEKVHACAHITGGGLDNVLRVIPKEMSVEIDDWAWEELYLEAQEKSGLSKDEMLKTFNCGTGMMFVVDKIAADDFKAQLPSEYEISTEGRVCSSLGEEQHWKIVKN